MDQRRKYERLIKYFAYFSICNCIFTIVLHITDNLTEINLAIILQINGFVHVFVYVYNQRFVVNLQTTVLLITLVTTQALINANKCHVILHTHTYIL